MPKYNPELTKADLIRYHLENQANSTFSNIFRINLTQDIRQSILKKFHENENHNVIVCYGLTGKGKSMGMLSLIREINPNFKVDNIYFWDEEILQNAKELEKPAWVVRDEDVRAGQFGLGSTRVKSQLDVLTQILRKDRISFTLVSAPFKPLATAQYYFRIIDRDDKSRITRFAVQDPETMRYLGAYYQKVMDDNDPFWVIYNEKKNTFMEKAKNQDYASGKPEYQKIIDEIMETLNPLIYITKRERKSFITERYSYMTRGEIEELATLLEIEMRKRDMDNEDNDKQNELSVGT